MSDINKFHLIWCTLDIYGQSSYLSLMTEMTMLRKQSSYSVLLSLGGLIDHE